MSPQPNSPHSVRRVVLPSGKTIEIVYFDDAPVDIVHPPASPVQDLHVCPSCSSPLVYPTAWDEAGEEHWELVLRCPNCEWVGEGVYEQASVERLDEELDTGTQALVRDLRQLAHANMEEEVERFVTALDADQILPMDF